MDGPMHSRPLVLLTGSAGRVGRALRAAMASSWHLQPYSRIPDQTCLPLSQLSASNSPIHGDALIQTQGLCRGARYDPKHILGCGAPAT